MHINIVQNRKIWFAISGLIIAVCIGSIAAFGLKFGIDFTGGSLLEITFPNPIVTTELKSSVEKFGFKDVVVQSTQGNSALIRMESLDEEKHQSLLKSLKAQYGEATAEQKFDSIGPVIGNELRKTALIGITLILILIGGYVAFAFRKVTHPVSSWKFGALIIITAFHDVVVPLGVFALLGRFFNWQVDTAFVAAILTVLGYSITDTIVVFDRTRENLLKRLHVPFEETVELSIRQTIRRSISTSMTVLLTLAAIFIFGGETTKPFALALIVGILAGTYSSIFLASPALVAWEMKKKS